MLILGDVKRHAVTFKAIEDGAVRNADAFEKEVGDWERKAAAAAAAAVEGEAVK